MNYLAGINEFFPPASLPLGDFSVRQVGFSSILFKRGSKVFFSLFRIGGKPDTQGGAQ